MPGRTGLWRGRRHPRSGVALPISTNDGPNRVTRTLDGNAIIAAPTNPIQRAASKL